MKTGSKPKRARRWLRWLAAGLAGFVLVVVALGFAFQWGWFDTPVRNLVVRELAQLTGGEVEVSRFHFDLFTLRANLEGITIRGKEPSGTPPLFYADSITAIIQVDSFWDKKFSLRDLRAVHPTVHVRFNSDGSSNLPVLKPPKGRRQAPARTAFRICDSPSRTGRRIASL